MNCYAEFLDCHGERVCGGTCSSAGGPGSPSASCCWSAWWRTRRCATLAAARFTADLRRGSAGLRHRADHGEVAGGQSAAGSGQRPARRDYERLTGFRLVFNTSFTLAREPIVNTSLSRCGPSSRRVRPACAGGQVGDGRRKASTNPGHARSEFTTGSLITISSRTSDGTLVATPEVPEEELLPSLLAASDVLGTGWFAAVAAGVPPGSTVAVGVVRQGPGCGDRAGSPSGTGLPGSLRSCTVLSCPQRWAAIVRSWWLFSCGQPPTSSVDITDKHHKSGCRRLASCASFNCVFGR